MSATFRDLLLNTLGTEPHRPALVHRGRAWSRADLLREAGQLGGRLRRLGLAPGDRVALTLAEKLPCLLAQLGVVLAGGVAVPLNPRLPEAELPYFVNDSGASLALVGPEQAIALEALRAVAPSLRHVVVSGADDEGTSVDFTPGCAPADPCLMIYSSGTTGWPKGVVHTQGSLASALGALARCWRMTPDDRVVNVLPLFHVHGLCFAAFLPLLAGGCVLLEDSFQPARTLDVVAQASVFMAVPTIYYRLLDTPEFRAGTRRWDVRLFTCGSAPIRPEILPQLQELLGGPVINRYGMTEAHVITSLPLDGPWPDGSVGVPLEGVEVEVRRDDGTLCPTSEVGNVRIQGPNLFRGYWNNPEATRAAFSEGWFETGDLGSRDARGFLTLAGRKHDLIITSGFNVYPAAVERVVNGCPGVRESAVLGVPDAIKGERVAAFIVRADPALDEATIDRFCRERLVDYQCPRRIVFVEALPRNAMGKVLKRELRERLGS
jgi:malonyl-CoA/methylmalonyl-CoA synthetase